MYLNTSLLLARGQYQITVVVARNRRLGHLPIRAHTGLLFFNEIIFYLIRLILTMTQICLSILESWVRWN